MGYGKLLRLRGLQSISTCANATLLTQRTLTNQETAELEKQKADSLAAAQAQTRADHKAAVCYSISRFLQQCYLLICLHLGRPQKTSRVSTSSEYAHRYTEYLQVYNECCQGYSRCIRGYERRTTAARSHASREEGEEESSKREVQG